MNRFAPIAPVVLWSSGFVGATLAAQSAPAETTLLWRYIVAVVPLLGWALWSRRRYGARFLVREGAIGILARGGYCPGVYRAADLGVLPGTSALVASLQPPLVAAVLWAGSGGRTDRRRALGLVTGLAGVLLVVGGDIGGAGGTAGLTAVGLGTLSLTVATLVASRWPEPPRERRDGLARRPVGRRARLLRGRRPRDRDRRATAGRRLLVGHRVARAAAGPRWLRHLLLRAADLRAGGRERPGST
ncbi:DMT family transporter [Nocardioides sp. B-3]|uniref:DMT family transporter n=1 Tax=Nocardioides sp. B-3 TaxID=2895565 RepID=UPI002152848E|nr:DMT family transporter [Nocardioides sp. B-3]UUZ59442.1 DMT family transporter [Nocardioides sp. B-3]